MRREYDSPRRVLEERFSPIQISPSSIDKLTLLVKKSPHGQKAGRDIFNTHQYYYLFDFAQKAISSNMQSNRESEAFLNGVGWGLSLLVLDHQEKNKEDTSVQKKPFPILPQSLLSEFATRNINQREHVLTKDYYKEFTLQEWDFFSQKYEYLTQEIKGFTDNVAFYDGIMWSISVYEQHRIQKQLTPSQDMKTELKRKRIRNIPKKIYAMEERFGDDKSLSLPHLVNIFTTRDKINHAARRVTKMTGEEVTAVIKDLENQFPKSI